MSVTDKNRLASKHLGRPGVLHFNIYVLIHPCILVTLLDKCTISTLGILLAKRCSPEFFGVSSRALLSFVIKMGRHAIMVQSILVDSDRDAMTATLPKQGFRNKKHYSTGCRNRFHSAHWFCECLTG